MKKEIVVKLVSKEIIKPSSPTPPHLRNYKISLLEQFGTPYYVSFVLFYLPPKNTTLATFEFQNPLKKSLSETLTRFYPLAGRLIKEDNIVKCNDEDIEYLEAQVEGSTISEFIDNPDVDAATPLFARRCELTGSPSDVLLAVQANYFDCGGVAIAVSFNHQVVDGATFGNLLECWASIARHHQHLTNEKAISPTFDGIANILPPISSLEAETTGAINNGKRLETSTRRFVFNGESIAALKARGTNVNDKIVPTRTQALLALLWKCLMSEAASEDTSSKKKTSVLVQMVNLRKRMIPPLPHVSFGNIIKIALAAWPIGNYDKSDDKLYQMLVKKIRDSVAVVDDAYAKDRGLDLKVIRVPLHEPFTKIIFGPGEKRACSATSLLRFPYYEIDFGWGVPLRVVTCDLVGEFILLMSSNLGVEALVCLEKSTMARFEKNPELLAYCSGITISRL